MAAETAKLSISMTNADAKKNTKSFDKLNAAATTSQLASFANSYIKITNSVLSTAKKTTNETIQLSTS